ncbi:MAG: hypothetical protein JEZ11_07560 [Desulfobacterales bacterium]|nr:hypothetical protein [Desulfobacterales bacterium]
MAGQPVPGGMAAAIKVLVDVVRDTFGAAIVVVCFLGFSLIALALGASNLPPGPRCTMMYVIVGLMVVILIGLFVIRIFKPIGLSGPPAPETDDGILKGMFSDRAIDF